MKNVFLIMLVALLPVCSYATTDIKIWKTNLASPQPVDPKTQVRAFMRQAKYMLERGDYKGAKNLFDRVLKLDPNNKEAKSLLEQCQSKLEEQLQIETSAYQSAFEKGTIEALQSFISSYPDGYHHQQAKDKIADIQLWNEAQSVASKEAYERYISQSPLKSHLKEAEEQITILSEDDEWNHCDTRSISDLERFLSRYPRSRFAERAKYHLNVLKGLDSYHNGDKLASFSYLEDAKKISPLYGDALNIYNNLYEEYTAPKMLLSNNANEIAQYLKELSPSSKNYNNISNHLALVLSSNFSENTTSADIDKALGYARNEATRNLVLTFASLNTSDKKVKASAHNTPSQDFNFTSWLKERFFVGIKLDAEKNVYEPSWAFDGGVEFKLGQYTDFVNLIIGANFRFYIFDNYPSNPKLAAIAKHSYITGGQIAIPLTARLNIIKVTDSWRLYVGGACNVQTKIHDGFNFLKSHSISFEPQAGFVSRHWDIGAHFRIFAMNPFVVYCRSNYIGIHSSYYF